MKSIAILIAALASVNAFPVLELREPSISFDLCEEVMNCEFYEKADGSKATRFIKGMEPDSDFIRELDANATALAKRQGGLARRQDNTCDKSTETCTSIDTSTAIRNYGDAFPRDIADGLYEHCLATSCGGSFDTTANYDRGGRVTEGSTLVAETQGAFATGEIRDLLIRTMTDIVGANIEVERRPCRNPQAFCSATIHRSPAAFGMTRTTPGGTEPAIAGQLEIRVSVESDSTGICSIITGAIGAAMPGPGGTALGIIAPIACGIIG